MARTKRKRRSRPATKAEVDRLRRGIIALYRAVAALAHEVTGRQMSIRVEREPGDVRWTTPDLSAVKWSPATTQIIPAASPPPTAGDVQCQRKIGF